MYRYGLNNEQLDDVVKYCEMFYKSFDDMILSCLGIAVKEWRYDDNILSKINPVKTSNNLVLKVDGEIRSGLFDFSYDNDLSISETINLMIVAVMSFLNSSFSDVQELSDSEKLEEPWIVNDRGGCWNEFFG